jgi:hypothetical protein
VDARNCVVSGNTANGTVRGEGGGIFSNGSILTLATTRVKGNKASTTGDDLFVDS